MAFTKVVGAGIHTLSNIASHNINSSGIITATKFVGPFDGTTGDFSGNVTIDGNLVVNGDTTTLNTTLREVELLRVDATNNTVAAGIITQRGSGDILNLYDGSTEVFSVTDGGDTTMTGKLSINTDGGGGALTLGASQDFRLYHDANGPTIFSDANNQGLKLQIKELNLTEYTGVTTKLKIDTGGNVIVNNTTAVAGSYTYKLLTSGNINSSEQTFGIQYPGVVTYGLNAESNADFTIKKDGAERLRINSVGNLEQTLATDAQGFKQTNSNNHYIYNIIDANRSAANDHILIQQGRWNGKNVAAMKFRAGADTSNKDDGYITFETSTANNQSEKVRITSGGKVGINLDDNTTADLQVCTPNTAHGLLRIGGNNTNGVGIDIDYSNSGHTKTTFKQNYRSNQATAEMSFESGFFTFISGTGSDERLRIDSSGRLIVGGGTHAGGSALVVKGGGVNTYSTVGLFGATATPSNNAIFAQIRFGSGTTQVGATINAKADADWGSLNDYPTRLEFYTAPDGSGTVVERLRISSDGDVGINNSNPAYPLDIRHVGGNLNQTPIIRLFQSTDGCHNALTLESSTSADKNIGIQFKNRNAVRGGIGYIQNDKINIYTGANAAAAQGLTINASGFCGINETDPAYPLEVVGDGGGSFAASTNSTNGTLSVVGKNSAGSISAISRIKSYPDTNSNQSHMAFETRNSSNAMVEAVRINSTQQVGIGTVSPSEKLHITVPGNQRQTMLRLQHIGQKNFYIQGQWGSTDIGGANGILQFIDGGHLAFRVGSSGKADMMLDQAGKVGINTDNPKAVLHARHDNTTNASTTFGATCGQILESEDSELAFGLQNSSPYPYYIQARTRVNTARDITLNPAGGAVAVGTNNSFARKLNVKGTIGALSPSQTTALDFEADDGQNTYISSYHASGSNLYIRTNYSGVGVQNRLHINGNGESSFYGTSSGNSIGITIRNTNTANYSHARLRLESQNNAKASDIYTDVPNDALRLQYNGSNSVYIKDTGRVGIQTSNPQSALHVRGSGGIRIDPLADTNIVSNANVVTDGGGNPYLSGTPWYQTSPYLYNTGNNPHMDYYWIKIVESFGYSTIAYVEYMCHSDSNYPRSVHGRIDFAKYGPHSINISHNTITPLTGITPQLVIDSNKRVWIKMNGAQWNSDFRFRMIYGESLNLNSDFTVGTDNNSAATGRMLDQDATPLNSSGIIEPGATFRWDLGSYTNPPVYWSGTNVSSTAGTYGDGVQDYGAGDSHFYKMRIKGRMNCTAGWNDHGMIMNSNYIGVNNGSQPVLMALKSQKNTTLQLDRMYSHGEILQFKQNSSNVGYINVTGSASSHVTSGSDIRLKKDIEDWTEEVLPYFKSLKPQKFRFNSEDETAEKTKGYMAQDNLDKFPEAYPLNSQDDRYWFAPQHMIPYLMKALQEEIVKREEIEAKYNALEARISALEGS